MASQEQKIVAHVDGSDHSVGVRAFRQRENSNTRNERPNILTNSDG
jgi:hypothetical protein